MLITNLSFKGTVKDSDSFLAGRLFHENYKLKNTFLTLLEKGNSQQTTNKNHFPLQTIAICSAHFSPSIAAEIIPPA